ncbi:nucleotidyl transferase domain-containing protein [Gottschalkia purinilytica]|uniref:Nucleotidyl transferase domain-containing protein n=1 Tax=Gottschalkia purinilytica TaxID=1503 RepID=A0A0L0WCL1_GOTPU|nr:hypothetical protein [Gottschalkia purinilytica]KNF09203.1 nucleotidyl transferase domain-containing protein [Gottschalkia purinilytica]
MYNEIFKRKIDDIVKKENPYGILLVGSASKQEKIDFENITDLDIFVILKNGEFEREVVNIEDIDYDVSYISIESLEFCIKNKISSVINVLANGKVIYKSGDTIDNILYQIKELYKAKPDKPLDYEKDYIRFKLTQQYFTVLNRKDDEINFEFLANIFIKDMIISYLKLNQRWILPDKKLLKEIKDDTLENIIKSYYKTNNINNKIQSLKMALEYIIEPFGGKLNYWKKGIYPFDFI